jgi:arabinogalactan endo-1,4-beta-galactosidase
MQRHISTLAFTLLTLFACNSEDKPIYPEQPAFDMAGFAKGADVSWLTEMERNNIKFYDVDGREKECMALLRALGMNAIRLRVWVNPANGWCNKGDVLAKAFRANNLDMRLMIDFHYSDSWADPGQQTKPAAWEGMTQEELQHAVAGHTKDVLNALKARNITPEWVQVGNETGNGMLWDNGKASVSMENYAKLNNAGYNAVKEVFPDAKVIVHLQEGNRNALFRWLFDGLKSNGGKWDVIGMSLYPEPGTWRTLNSDCLANIDDMIRRYGSEVMICEVGMSYDAPEEAKAFLTDIIAKAAGNGKCLGLFYWEPQCYNRWNGYTKGAFDNSGRPTRALDAFKRTTE